MAQTTSRQVSPMTKFIGGINTSKDVTLIGNDECTDSDNIVIGNDGVAMKRYGNNRVNAIPLNQQVTRSINIELDCLNVEGSPITGGVLLLHSGTTIDAYVLSTGVLLGSTPLTNTGYTRPMFFENYTSNAWMAYTETGKYIATGDQTPMIQFLASGAGGFNSQTAQPNARYVKKHKNYYFIGYVKTSSIVYSNRVYFSPLDTFTFADTDYFSVNPGDGDYITQLGSLKGILHVFKNRSIYGVYGNSFTTDEDSDISISPISTNIGLIADKTLASTGDYYIFLSNDGIRMFDGGTSTIISGNIKSIIDGIVNPSDCAGFYDPKNNWYWFSYCDSTGYPSTVNNRVLIYDLRTGTWHKISGFNANCFAIYNSPTNTNNNKLYYGDANEGFAYEAQYTSAYTDDENTKAIRSMETTETWTATTGTAAVDTTNFKEGTQGEKLTPTANIGTIKSTFATKDLTVFNDNTSSSTSDLIEFWVYAELKAKFGVLYVKLYSTATNDTIRFHKTIDMTSFVNGWNKVSDAKSTYTTVGAALWTDIQGVEIQIATTDNQPVTFDDLRLVGASRVTRTASITTKEHDLQSPETDKVFKQLTFNDNNVSTVVKTAYYEREATSSVITKYLNHLATSFKIKFSDTSSSAWKLYKAFFTYLSRVVR